MYIVGRPGSKRRKFRFWSIYAKSWDSMGSIWRSPICWRAWSHSIQRHANRDVGRAAHSRSQSVYLDGLISCLFDFRDYSRHRSRRCFHHRRPDLDVRRTIRAKTWPARGILRSNQWAPWHCPRYVHARCSSSCERKKLLASIFVFHKERAGVTPGKSHNRRPVTRLLKFGC
jgi:hypothetical protein